LMFLILRLVVILL